MTMKQKMVGFTVLMALLAMMLLGACTSSLAEQAKTGQERVKKEALVEKELLYDNGKNFLTVNSKDWTVITAVLQEWKDQHPDKQLIFGAPAATGDSSSDRLCVWTVYYENRK